jgi:hypothetical protein
MSPIVPTIILAILIVGIVLFIKMKVPQASETASPEKEPFADSSTSIPNVTFCPLNSTATILQSGETHCCIGKTSKKFGCLEKTVCTLSPTGDGKIESCGSVLNKYYVEQAKKHCYPGMPKYYEKVNEQGLVTERGCYSGPTNMDYTGPANNTQPTCFVDYSDADKVASDPKSCFNAKRLDAKVCPPGVKCTKQFIKQGKGRPLALQISWMGKRKIFGKWIDAPVTTYTMSSVIDNWNKIWPDWHRADWNSFSAEQLGELFFEVRREMLGAYKGNGYAWPVRHHHEKKIFWDYVNWFVVHGDKHPY